MCWCIYDGGEKICDDYDENMIGGVMWGIILCGLDFVVDFVCNVIYSTNLNSLILRRHKKIIYNVELT